ncbi:MAG: hypothetical protein R3D78_05695 [Paracoccaceae bacterium]
MSLLRLETLSVEIGGAPILREVSLDLAPGEILALSARAARASR